MRPSRIFGHPHVRHRGPVVARPRRRCDWSRWCRVRPVRDGERERQGAMQYAHQVLVDPLGRSPDSLTIGPGPGELIDKRASRLIDGGVWTLGRRWSTAWPLVGRGAGVMAHRLVGSSLGRVHGIGSLCRKGYVGWRGFSGSLRAQGSSSHPEAVRHPRARPRSSAAAFRSFPPLLRRPRSVTETSFRAGFSRGIEKWAGKNRPGAVYRAWRSRSI